MPGIRERIGQLSAATGFLVNPLEKIQLVTLENDIANLTHEIGAKRATLEIVEEQSQAAKAELTAQKAFYASFLEGIRNDVDLLSQQFDILKQYFSTIENGEDFLPNKLAIELNDLAREYWNKLRPLHNKAKEVNKKLGVLRELQNKCDELRQKAI